MNHAIGVVHWLAADVATTTYTVNLDAGFDLKAIRFYATGLHSATDAVSGASARSGVGFATGTASRRAVGGFDITAHATNVCGSAIRNDCVMVTAATDGTTTGALDITTFSSTQFVLTVDDQIPGDLTIGWEAWGGSDITVATVIDISEPAATGVQSYTVTGFVASATDQVVMLAGCNVTAALNSASDVGTGTYIGYCTGSASANNIVIVGNNEDGAATSDCSGYCQTGECLAMIPPTGGSAVTARAIGAFATDAFTLNWLERGTTDRKSVALCIKGGYWQTGAYTIDGATLNATATVSGLAFQPIGVDLIGAMRAENAVDTATSHKRLGFGSAKSTTSRQSMGLLAVTALADSDINIALEYDSALCFPSATGTLQAAYDLDALTSDGFRIIVDVAGGVASEWQGYLAFASATSELAPQSRIVNTSFAVTRASSY